MQRGGLTTLHYEDACKNCANQELHTGRQNGTVAAFCLQAVGGIISLLRLNVVGLTVNHLYEVVEL